MSAACSPEPQRQTDVRRKIRDSWVDWNDHIQAWQRLSAEGQNVIAAVANIKLMAVASDEEADGCEGDSLHRRAASIEKHSLHNKIEELCDQLIKIYTNMKSLVQKMERTTCELGAMSELQQYKLQNTTTSSQAAFEACDTTTFYSTSKTLSDQYRRELAVKETIVENVALTSDRNLLMRYKLTWWCEPYVSDSTESLLEANLVATGLKK